MKFDSIRRANAAKVFSFWGDFFLNPWNNFCIFLLSIRILCPELFFSIFFFKILETFFIFISIRILRSEIFLGFFFQTSWNIFFVFFSKCLKRCFYFVPSIRILYSEIFYFLLPNSWNNFCFPSSIRILCLEIFFPIFFFNMLRQNWRKRQIST